MASELRLLWNGRLLEHERYGPDSCIVKGFLQKIGGIIFPDNLLRTLLAPGEAPCINRRELTMKYRGNELRRTKFFLVDSVDPMPVYYYTGFQWGSTDFYRSLDEVPAVKRITAALNTDLVIQIDGTDTRKDSYNHVIGTKYLTATDAIGYHMDKTRSFTPNSRILLLSLGGQREFHLKCNATEKVTSVVVEHGDLFVLGWETNRTFKHAIVPVAEETTLDPHRTLRTRLSLCFRDIAQREPAESRRRRVEASARARERRARVKAEKKAEKKQQQQQQPAAAVAKQKKMKRQAEAIPPVATKVGVATEVGASASSSRRRRRHHHHAPAPASSSSSSSASSSNRGAQTKKLKRARLN